MAISDISFSVQFSLISLIYLDYFHYENIEEK
jgi:hypothetical protein